MRSQKRNRDQKRERLRGVQMLAGRLTGRNRFVEDLLCAIGTLAAAARHTKTQMEFAQRTGTLAHRVADLAFGNAVAEANVHGLFVD